MKFCSEVFACVLVIGKSREGFYYFRSTYKVICSIFRTNIIFAGTSPIFNAGE